MAEEKRFGFVPVASQITPVEPIELAQDEQLELIHSGGLLLSDSQVLSGFPVFFFILTGGTEQKVYNLLLKRREVFTNEPVTILAHSGNNSLPAALEILARLNQEDIKGNIIYLDFETNKECRAEIEEALRNLKIYHRLKQARIGLIGNPSDWLIASMPDFGMIKKIWGPEIISIDMNELKTLISETTDDEIEDTHYYFTGNAVEIKEPGKKDIKNVVKVYAAIKKLIQRYNLSSVSVRCFDLVLDLQTTGCFALAKLNDDGIVAGCEGDLVSTIGMLWASYFSDQPVWMANPARISEHENSIWLAHCTVPMSMVDSYKLRSHFESDLGVGIQGELSKGKATLLRLGGKNLDRLWISNAEITESGHEENLCRTQVHIKLHGALKVTDLLKEPLGNHMLLFRGSFAREMQTWFNTFINP